MAISHKKMNNNLQTMRALMLTGITDRFEAINDLPQHQRPQADVFKGQLLEAEKQYRNHRRST
jgi:hypothetical protein